MLAGIPPEQNIFAHILKNTRVGWCVLGIYACAAPGRQAGKRPLAVSPNLELVVDIESCFVVARCVLDTQTSNLLIDSVTRSCRMVGSIGFGRGK